MPKKSRLQNTKDLSPPPLPEHDLPLRTVEADTTPFTKQNAGNTITQRASKNNETLLEEELARDESESPAPVPRPSSLLSQLPHGFPSTRKSQPVNIRDSLSPSEKVSDQEYTPPGETWLNDVGYSKSPHAPSISSAGLGETPPLEPGFSKRNSFTVRTPPVSPPQRNARPVSYGGMVPPMPPIPQFPPSVYGSPPAPHLPQQHFYAAQDVNLGIPRHSHSTITEEFSLTKLVTLPSIHNDTQQGFLLGSGSRLEVFAYNGTKSDHVGSLNIQDGTIVDACFLSWSSGTDPLHHLRPLIAITSFGKEQNDEQAAVNDISTLHAASWPSITRVDVYSLKTGGFIAELLSSPPNQPQSNFSGLPPPEAGPIGSLKLLTSGNFFIIASGTSGEVFVFGIEQQDVPSFSCLAKLWTNPQPQSVRRDSTHQRGSDTDYSPADPRRGRSSSDVPTIAASGRWLAICPASVSTRTTLGFSLGEHVLVRRNAGLDSSTAPAKPTINCDVDSPDADTLLSKMARGVAQEVVKGARWLGDQGLQAWQNYWKKDTSISPDGRSHVNLQHYPVSAPYGVFPPTHGDVSQTSKEPELVSIFDLKLLSIADTRKTQTSTPLATFQPPKGCSFLSFAPHGLNLLTASRKGDFQYVWDLLQIRYPRATQSLSGTESSKTQPCVRQVARYERLSGTTIVDVVWETPTARRFAVLTKNKTIHLFDLPANALRWPPPRSTKPSRPISAPPDGTQQENSNQPSTGGFFASAMNFAGQTQPMFANLRGRAPSTGSGLAGIGSTGIGLASATGARGSKAVATGLSKSLGAATETVSRLQQAYESRKHLKHTKEVSSDRLAWLDRGATIGICALEDTEVRFFQTHKARSRDQRQRTDTTVFHAGKSTVCKLSVPEPNAATSTSESFWKLNTPSVNTSNSVAHPLSFAEIETNAPYQPFHSDRRVTISVYTNTAIGESPLPVAPNQGNRKPESQKASTSSDQWVFGDEVAVKKLQLSHPRVSEDDTGSVIYRETTLSGTTGSEGTEQIVSTTRRKKQRRAGNGGATSSSIRDRDHDIPDDQEGFFEDDCDVLDFATDRV